MRRGRLSLFFAVLMLAAAAGALAADTSAAVNKNKAAVDTAAVKKAGADTAAVKKTAVDTVAAKKAGADTATAGKPAVDTAKSATDTAAVNKSAVDTAKAGADTASAGKAAAADAAPANTPAVDTSARPKALSVSTDTAVTPESALTPASKPASKPTSTALKTIRDRALYILFFAASLAIIAATLYYFSKSRKNRRFLTTMRLSVLDRMVQKACRYIEANYANAKLTPAAVCRELVTGEAYLDILFTREIGVSVQDFITQVRVSSVKFLLSGEPGVDPEAACVRSGFADRAEAERHFARFNGGVGLEDFAKSVK